MTIYIKRPPLIKTFDLPTREQLLNVKVGDSVKLIFEDVDMQPPNLERMWVKVTKRDAMDQWEGTLDNQPYFLDMSLGDTVPFHPLDIIRILVENEPVPSIQTEPDPPEENSL